MCGDERLSSYQDRYGALAVMSPSPPATPRANPLEAIPPVSGSISFYNKTDPSSQVATHLKFAPSPGSASPRIHRRMLLDIGSDGDLRTSSATRHDLTSMISLDTPQTLGDDSVSAVDIALRTPLYLHVGPDKDGNNGIIGRRVALWSQSSDTDDRLPTNHATSRMLAEGIVGFNSLPVSGRI